MSTYSMPQPNTQHKLLKSYEQRILQLTNQRDLQRNYSGQLKSMIDILTKQLQQSHKANNEKSLQLTKTSKKLQKSELRENQLQLVLRESEKNRKYLHDHILIKPTTHNNHKQSEHAINLSYQLNAIKFDGYQQLMNQQANVIKQQNQKIMELKKRNIELNREMLMATSEYHNKNQKLKSDNNRLREKVQKLQCVHTKLKELSIDYEKNNDGFLMIENKTMKERQEYLMQYIIEIQGKLLALKSQTSKKHQSQTIKLTSKSQQLQQSEQIDNCLQIITQKQVLQQQLMKLQQKYYILCQQFPNYIQNQQEILSLTKKCNQISLYQSNIQMKDDEIVNLNLKIGQIQKLRSEQQSEYQEIISNYFGEVTMQREIIEKLNQFFVKMNPHFQIYQYDIVGLTQQELKRIKDNTSHQMLENRTNLNDLKMTVQKLQNQLKFKQRKLQSITKTVESLNKQIIVLQETNFQLINNNNKDISNQQATQYPNWHKNAINSLGTIFFNKFAIIQQQRNNLLRNLKAKQLKEIEMTIQNLKLKDNLAQSNQSNKNNQLDTNQLEILQIKNTSVYISDYKPIINKINTQIINTLKQIQLIRQQHKKQKQQIIIQYQTLITTLRNQIKQSAIPITSTIRDKNDIQSEKSSQRNGQIVIEQSVHDLGTVLDIGEQQCMENQSDILSNALSPESLENLGKVLSGHEIMLKNIITAYNNMKIRLFQLQKQKVQTTTIASTNNQLRKQLQQSQNQQQLSLKRLQQADNNIKALNQTIAQQNETITKNIENYHENVQLLNHKIEQLTNENKQCHQELTKCSSQSYSTIKRTEQFSEQIQFLLQILQGKKAELFIANQQLSNLHKQINTNISQNVENPKTTNNQSKITVYKEIQRILTCEDWLQILDKAIEIIKKSKQK